MTLPEMTKCYGQYRWDPETDDMVWDTVHSLELNFHTIGLMHLMFHLGKKCEWEDIHGYIGWECNTNGKVATFEY